MTVLERLARLVSTTAPGGRALVGIDGVDTSGKTTMADALADLVTRLVVRVSVDDFHRPPEVRYRRGRRSAEGCYRDTFDHDAIRARVLEPEGDVVVLVDGVFLMRPELDVGWHLVVHLRVPDEEVLRRAPLRDGCGVEDLYRERYLPAQRLYEAQCRPVERAQVVIDNTDVASPVVLRWPIDV